MASTRLVFISMLVAFTLVCHAAAFAPRPAVVRPCFSSKPSCGSAARMVPLPDNVMMISASSSLVLAETQAWVAPTATVLDIFLNVLSLGMLCRVVLSWYPDMMKPKPTDDEDGGFSWITAVVIPTEPFLRAVKGIIPPAFGVDITPVFWLGVFTFAHEILLGQQGLLTMKVKYGI